MGDDVSDTLAAVLRAEPDWTALPVKMPSSMRMLLDGCLKKDRTQRFGDISTALFLVKEPSETFGRPSEPHVSPHWPLWKRAMPIAATALVVVTLTSGAWWILRPVAPSAPIVSRFSIPLPEGQQFINFGRRGIAMSPDGTQIVYVANRQLYLRSM